LALALALLGLEALSPAFQKQIYASDSLQLKYDDWTYSYKNQILLTAFTLKTLALNLINISRIKVCEPRDEQDIPVA
jgi:hypothetical protein